MKALLHALTDAARAKGVTAFRVDYKRNKRGDLVVALIIPDDGTGPWSRFSLGE